MFGEIPVIFAVILQSGAVADKMLVLERHLRRILGAELVAIVHIVPTQTKLQIEVTQVEIDRCQLALELIIEDIVFAIALHIHIHVVAAESVAEHRACEETGVNGQFCTRHQAFA